MLATKQCMQFQRIKRAFFPRDFSILNFSDISCLKNKIFNFHLNLKNLRAKHLNKHKYAKQNNMMFPSETLFSRSVAEMLRQDLKQ